MLANHLQVGRVFPLGFDCKGKHLLSFEALWCGGNCSYREVGADLKFRARYSCVNPAGSVNLCRKLHTPRWCLLGELPFTLVTPLGWRAGFAQHLMADLILLFLLLLISFLPFPLNCYLPEVFKTFFISFFFNLTFISSLSPRPLHFLFPEALLFGLVTLSVVYGQKGSTPLIDKGSVCVCIKKKARIYC